MIMAEMLFLFSETLPSYTLAICFISFGVAAKSGADIASLHDLITHENINSTFEKEISGFMAMKTIWPIFAIIIGSNCFTYNNKLLISFNNGCQRYINYKFCLSFRSFIHRTYNHPC